MQRVRSVMVAESCDTSIRYVPGSMSTNRGVPPAVTIAATVGIAVFDVVITSSPGRMPSARNASTSASVPLPTPTPFPAPQ